MLIKTVWSIERSVDGLLEVAGEVAGNTANIPQLQATAPVLGLIVEEAVVQDGYMNALTDGFGECMSDYDLLLLLSVMLAVIVVVGPRRGADRGPPAPACGSRRASRRSASALKGVEAEHLQPLEGAVKAINAQFDVILSALPGIGRKAAVVAERRPR